MTDLEPPMQCCWSSAYRVASTLAYCITMHLPLSTSDMVCHLPRPFVGNGRTYESFHYQLCTIYINKFARNSGPDYIKQETPFNYKLTSWQNFPQSEDECIDADLVRTTIHHYTFLGSIYCSPINSFTEKDIRLRHVCTKCRYIIITIEKYTLQIFQAKYLRRFVIIQSNTVGHGRPPDKCFCRPVDVIQTVKLYLSGSVVATTVAAKKYFSTRKPQTDLYLSQRRRMRCSERQR